MKRMKQKEEEEKKSSTGRDGAKLSFQEKMELFAAESGGMSGRDKSKISKVQREIDDSKQRQAELAENIE